MRQCQQAGRGLNRRRIRTNRNAFTLVELLVVIAIIAVLMAMILPKLAKARLLAKDAICASNLHQISLGATEYHQNNSNKYPAPMINFSSDYIKDMQSRLINDLAPYLNIPLIPNNLNSPYDYPAPGTAPTTANMPRIFLCPQLNGQMYGPVTWNGPTYWGCGYMYIARADEPPNLATLLKPERAATNQQLNAVLFADTVYFDRGSSYPAYWDFPHGSTDPNVYLAGVTDGSYPDASTLRGQHRAWTDASVEWVNGSTINPTVVNAATTASYTLVNQIYWWF